jgi:hypothetical protein
VNLLGNNIDTIKKSTETLIDASKAVGLEVNTQKINCVLMSCHLNARENHDTKTANRFSKNSGKVKIFGNNSNKSIFDS